MIASRTLRVVVSGMVAAVPGHGGATWAVLQYLLGLRRLGHDVHFVECVPAGPTPAAWCETVMDAVGLTGGWTLIDADGATTGASRETLAAFCRTADVLLDLSGKAASIAEAMTVPVRVYVDLDPGFTQIWHEQGCDVGIAGHTHYASVGTAVGTAASMVPDLGLRWIPTLPPVVLDHWPAQAQAARGAFTTVGNWRSYGPVHVDGVMLGQRAHSMRALLDLPMLTGESFAVALAIGAGDSADADALRRHGWNLVEPGLAAGTPEHYQHFIGGSKAEIGVAKHAYVAAGTGWFSDRSACYLATGRPVVTQDTGLAGLVPTDRGMLTFNDLDGARDAVLRVGRDADTHARGARDIAEEHLDSDRVLTRLLSEVGAA